jgi:hypothetical protein
MTMEESLRSWLKTQGYPLEMKVAELLRKSEIPWSHGRVYSDPTTGKSREIDLMGYIDFWHDYEFAVHLTFECKHTRDKPWVIFTTDSPTLTRAGYVDAMPATPEGKDDLRRVADIPAIQEYLIFQRPQLEGFNFVRAMSDNQDAAFQAIRGVASACLSTARWIGENGHSVVYVPIVVVDSPLFECHLPMGQEEVELVQVQHGMMLYNSGESHVPIHVVHVDGLESFISTAKINATELHQRLVQENSSEVEPRGSHIAQPRTP